MKTNEIFWILGGVAVYYLYKRYQENSPLVFTQVSGETDNAPGFFDTASEVFQPGLTDMNDNRKAFLAVIRATEGTDQYANPYAVIFGGKELDPPDFSEHPANLGFTEWVHFSDKGKDNYSTASGAYQFTVKTWNRLRDKLGLTDFGPGNQDLAALELVREKGALSDVDNGNVIGAVHACNTIWASFPGSPYGQSTKSEDFVINTFNNALA